MTVHSHISEHSNENCYSVNSLSIAKRPDFGIGISKLLGVILHSLEKKGIKFNYTCK